MRNKIMSKKFLSNTGDNDHIKEYLEKHLAKYGDMNYAYIVINKRNMDDIVVISDISDYFNDVYLSCKYQSIDPIIVNALNRISPLVWDENLMIDSRWTINKIFNSVKPYYNIISGQTFILHDQNNNLALLSLYINKFLMDDTNEKVKKHKDELQGLLISTHEIFLHLYHEDKLNKSAKNYKKLSSRETEILYWSSVGKTYSEIAIILGIKSSTVKFHMGNIVKKFGVSNAKHAISLGIELNIVYPLSH